MVWPKPSESFAVGGILGYVLESPGSFQEGEKKAPLLKAAPQTD